MLGPHRIAAVARLPEGQEQLTVAAELLNAAFEHVADQQVPLVVDPYRQRADELSIVGPRLADCAKECAG